MGADGPRAEEGRDREHVLANETATLVWLANQNCITPHVFTARADRLDRAGPDHLGSRPVGRPTSSRSCSRTALALGRSCARRAASRSRWHGLARDPRRRGAHAPLVLEAVRDAALAVADALAEQHPDELTTAFRKEKREGRLFLDVNRNGRAQTAVPAYAVRPRPGAPVATPVHWPEVEDDGLRPDAWTLATVRDRLAGDGDPWADLAAAAGALPRLS